MLFRKSARASLLALFCASVFSIDSAAQTLGAPVTAGQASAGKQPKPSRQFAEKPLWILWHSGFNEQNALSYVKSVGEETGIADDFGEQLRGEFDKDRESLESQPIKGTAMFMLKGLIPGVETLEFRELADPAEFDKIVKERQRQYGGKAAKITGSGNLKKVEIFRKYESPKYEMKTTKKEDGTTEKRWQPALDKDGKQIMQTHEWSQESYFRLEKGVLFEARFAELHDMELPAADKLGLGRRKREDDLYFHADLRLVPPGLKTVVWGMVSSQANMMMQQRDLENRVPYKFRKSVSNVALELLRSAIYDVEEATGSIKFATSTKPVRGSFSLKVRSNSNMAKQLRAMGEARGRLPMDDHAVISLRSTWAMPAAFREMLTTAAPYLRKIAEEDFSADEPRAGLNGIADAFEGTAEDGVFEAAVNFGGTAESGPVLYGAVRADKGDKLSTGLHALINYGLSKANEPNLPTVDTIDGNDGREYVRIAFPDMPWPTKSRPTHAFLGGDNGAVWFAIGSEDAWQMLDAKMDRKDVKRGRSALLDFSIDLTRFLDADDPAGLGELGARLDLEFDEFANASAAFGGDVDLKQLDLPPNRALLANTLADGDGKLSLSVDSDKKGVFVRGELGEPLARYLTARYMSVVNRMIIRQQAIMELQMEKRKLEAQEAAQRVQDGE